MDEQAEFDAWRHTVPGFITGWMIWCAARRTRGLAPDRDGFDAWLFVARATDWTELDCWAAALEPRRG
jgi:hypothetical protein